MLGVAILLGLALWFIIVCLATFLPLILIRNKRAACIVALLVLCSPLVAGGLNGLLKDNVPIGQEWKPASRQN